MLAALGFAQPAFAESCAYDAGTRTVTASITAGGQATLVVSGGELWFGATPAACGAATTLNTNSITITGGAGSLEQLILDNRGGVFGPGQAAESNTPEIEIATALGDATDKVIVYGTVGDDFMAAGQNGLAANSDGDVDVTFSPAAFPLEVHLLDGNDYFNGRGQGGAGLHFLGPIVLTGGDGDESLLRGSSEIDSIDGGPGNDVLQGQESADTLTGGDGNDTLSARRRERPVNGGPGVDVFNGSGGDDTLVAEDGEADTSINGGPGFDTAFLDLDRPGDARRGGRHPTDPVVHLRRREQVALAGDDACLDGNARGRERGDLVGSSAGSVRRRDGDEHRLDLDRRRPGHKRDADPRPAGRCLRPRSRRRSPTPPRSRSRRRSGPLRTA